MQGRLILLVIITLGLFVSSETLDIEYHFNSNDRKEIRQKLIVSSVNQQTYFNGIFQDNNNLSFPHIQSTDGLVGYWDFNEGSGDTIYDQSGYDNHCPYSGGRWVEGIEGFAFEFIDNWLICDKDPSFSVTEFTISAWIYIYGQTSSWHQILGQYDAQPGSYLLELSPDSQSPVLTVVGDQSIEVWPSNKINFNEWTLIVGTFDRNSAKIYINDEMIINEITNFQLPESSSNIVIGSTPYHYGGGYPFNGLMDDVRLYNRSLNIIEMVLS